MTSIGYGVFHSCYLSSIVVESGNSNYDSRDNSNAIIETATNTLIAGCKNTVIPNSVTSIGDGAFRFCYDLTSVIIPNSVTNIGYGAFEKCSSLTSVTIPNSLTSIGEAAFAGTSWYNNQPDGLVYAGKVAYEYKGTMPDNTALEIDDGTLGIGNAFMWLSSLTSVTIPSSVKTIGDNAFYGCSGLSSVTALMEEPFAIAPFTFLYDTYNSATLYVPYGTKAKYEVTDGWKEFKTIVELPASAIIPSYDVDGNGEVDKEDMNCLVKKILGQANDTDDENYSYDVNNNGKVDIEDLACLIFRFSGKSIGQMSLPEESEMNGKDLTITVDGDTISVDNDGCYDAKGSTIMATNNDGEIVYMNISSVEKSYNAAGADLNAKESAITLMLPLVPNIFVAFDDEHLPHLKEMIWDVDEVKQLAAAIDRSVAKYGYTDFGEISSEATAARNKISQLLHLDKLAERQAETASLARGQAMLRASRSTESPYIVNPYGFGGLEVEITNSKKKQFYTPQNISGYNCDVTAYNYNRFAYSSMVKGKYNADTNTYYVPDFDDDYEYLKNILKPQKVSTFMETFTSFKYEDLERLGQFLEESVNLVQGDTWFDEMHWDDEKKTANFDISEQDDAIILLFPRGNNYILVYNIFQSIVKPIVKFMSKKVSKSLDSEVVLPVLIGGMASDIDYIIELESTLDNPKLGVSEKIEKITSLTWTKFFKALDKSFQGDFDAAIKESFTEFVDNTVDEVGGYDAALDWAVVKKAFKYLEWVKKIGDILTGTLGLFMEDNAVYPIHWEARGQFVLAQNEATVGEGECVKVRVLVGSNSYLCESSDEKIATVKSNHDKIEITGVDAGTAIITVRDKIAQKTAKITVNVTGIQTFVLASSSVSVPVYEDRSVTIERGDGPFHVYGGDEKIAVAKMGGGNPIIFPGEKYAVVISGVSEGSTTFYVFNGATNQILPLTVNVTAEEVVITDEPIVDLGLSVNWANCNVGASEPQEYGDYFAWGEVNSKDYFSPNNYQYYSNGNFVDIGSDISGTEYDAATRNMGSDWRMPTKAEYEELINKCEWKFITYRRERGWKVTGPNGNSIFLPVAGYMLNDWNDDASIYGHYWSSNITDNLREVYTLYASMSNYKMAYGYMNRFEGRTVRSVRSKSADPINTGTTTFTVNGVSFKMVRVSGGTFQMGATAEQGSDAYYDEYPVHSVTLSDFAIGETEVTQALWQAVMGQTPTSGGSQWSSSYGLGADYPAYWVSRTNCLAFISKLNELTGLTFRLPTEAEWEFAARGGNSSQGYKYAGSNTLNDVAWYRDNSSSKTHAVGTKSPNELGLYDMSGNVDEYCQDWYGSYSYSSTIQTNPTGPAGPSQYPPCRVVRGGNCYDDAGSCRVSSRSNIDVQSYANSLGLRLAL